VNEQLFWYIARSSGIVSWALLSTSVLCGVMLSTRLLGKRPAPSWLLDFHRFLGGAACAFVAVHLAGLVADSYVYFGPSELLVPLASTWRPVAVAWGVVALYLLAAVELTSLLKRRLPARFWRRVHGTSFVLWVFSTVHAFSAGTDAANVVYQWAGVAIGLAVVYTVTVRILSPRPDRPPRPAREVAGAATTR
jgi:predicted ferric reductase